MLRTSSSIAKKLSCTKSTSTGQLAAAHLLAADKRFEPLVAAQGPIDLGGVKKASTAFGALLKTIVFQQLAAKAANTIHTRVLDAVKSDPPTPAGVLSTPYADLRGAGLSERKASYIIDLATHFADGRLSDEMLQTASDEEVIAALTAVKGIGPSSCNSFMIFQLCRPDILPTTDMRVQKNMGKFLGFGDKTLSPAEMEGLSSSWSPYRSYASYYLWCDRSM